MLATWVMFTYQCPLTAKPHRKSVWGRSVTPWFSGLSDGSHRFVRNGVVGNLCPVFVLRSNMCPLTCLEGLRVELAAPRRSLSPFKWPLIACAPLVVAAM
jgi:hypothetical protein